MQRTPVEVVLDNQYCNNEPEELAVLGSMEFAVLPAECAERTKRSKPYDKKEARKENETKIPEVVPRAPPNQAYVKLLPTILKHPLQSMRPNKEDEVMKEVGDEPKTTKGKGREHPVILHPS